jgi:hypothetical protein
LQPKQPQQGESSGNNGNNKDNKGNSSHGKRGGKDKKKEKKKQHGNLTSVAINPFTTITGSGSIIPLVPLLQHLADIPAMKDPRKQQPAQRFISASPSNSSSSVFPEYQQAHNALDALDLAKSVHNLKPLEIEFTKRALKKRKIKGETQLDLGDLNIVSLDSSPRSPGPYNDIPGNPNGTAERWDEIDNCYIEVDRLIPTWLTIYRIRKP